MKKAEKVTLERYDAGDGFFVDVVSKDGVREAWLSHDSVGISALMFGIPVRQEGRPAMFYNEFLRIVEANLAKYKDDYMHEYFY